MDIEDVRVVSLQQVSVVYLGEKWFTLNEFKCFSASRFPLSHHLTGFSYIAKWAKAPSCCSAVYSFSPEACCFLVTASACTVKTSHSTTLLLNG